LAIHGIAFGQSHESKTVPKRLESIESAMQSIQQQLAELSSMLRASLPPPPSSDIAPISLNIADAQVLGSPTSKFALIEYSDFECPYCGQHATTVYPLIRSNYVDTGKIRYVFRNLPLEQLHPSARRAAEAGQCAAEQGKFWEYHDQIFANQKALAPSDLSTYARNQGLDVPRFQSCLLEGKTSAKVAQDLSEARRLGLTGTPAFLFGEFNSDGTVRVTRKMMGTQSFQAFQSTLDTLLVGSK